MSETALTVTKSALQEILVQASEAPLEPDESQDAITYMNRFMATLAAKGVNLGYTVVDDIADEITIPDGAIEGLVLNLAMRLAPGYDKAVSMDLRSNARDALKAMYNIAVLIAPARFPGTVPVGSGNEGDLQTQHFYPEREGQIQTEVTGPILLEEATE